MISLTITQYLGGQFGHRDQEMGHVDGYLKSTIDQPDADGFETLTLSIRQSTDRKRTRSAAITLDVDGAVEVYTATRAFLAQHHPGALAPDEGATR